MLGMMLRAHHKCGGQAFERAALAFITVQRPSRALLRKSLKIASVTKPETMARGEQGSDAPRIAATCVASVTAACLDFVRDERTEALESVLHRPNSVVDHLGFVQRTFRQCSPWSAAIPTAQPPEQAQQHPLLMRHKVGRQGLIGIDRRARLTRCLRQDVFWPVDATLRDRAENSNDMSTHER